MPFSNQCVGTMMGAKYIIQSISNPMPHMHIIKKGQLSEPVREITIASTLQRMLLEVLDIGNDLERLPMRASGVSLVVADVTVSGV